jgi:broad-specificity NMP kinase
MSLAGILFSNDMLSGKAVEISGYIKTDSLQKAARNCFITITEKSPRHLRANVYRIIPWTLFTSGSISIQAVKERE